MKQRRLSYSCIQTKPPSALPTGAFRMAENPVRGFPPNEYIMVCLPTASIAIIKLLRKAPQAAACIICPPMASKFHTGSLICDYGAVHARTRNDLYFLCSLRSKFCEAFLTCTKTPSALPTGSLCWGNTRYGDRKIEGMVIISNLLQFGILKNQKSTSVS